MADEVEMTPVELTPVELTPVTNEPPAANPLARPAEAASPASPVPPASAADSPTLKLPPRPGATVSGLKPGLKLPPRPGATVAGLKPGLKLPPKPGATISGLKPGLKLPPKPGATVTALKPGLKLPAKPGIPQIRKPGASVGVKPLPRPVNAAPAPAAAPATPAAEVPQPKPIDALKGVTQKLKGVTQQIPQQAVLRKTGIIADGAVTDAQKEAAKHKTARISLADAIGAAPVQNENAPMKTIRIKRPSDIVGGTERLTPKPPVANAAAAVEPAAVAAAAAPAATSAATAITQRKTLKISRPGAVKPAGKFSVKKPGAAKPAVSEPNADIADIPEMPAAFGAPVPVRQAPPPAPSWVQALSVTVQVAACVAMGVLAWFLYQNTQTNYF